MIQFDHVFKTYRNSEEAVIKDVCMTLPSGQITVLIGPSGCGKTTLTRLMNGLAPSDQNQLGNDHNRRRRYPKPGSDSSAAQYGLCHTTDRLVSAYDDPGKH